MNKFVVELAQATLIATTIGFPFVIYFWNMKP